ncbi:MAG: hypothetical protein KDA71_17340, partial [Planctomycetales bacterium]|nr:hypothetical protein [Planctomycetales bacterium]
MLPLLAPAVRPVRPVLACQVPVCQKCQRQPVPPELVQPELPARDYQTGCPSPERRERPPRQV